VFANNKAIDLDHDKFSAKLYEQGDKPNEVDFNSSNLPHILKNCHLSVIVECIGIWFKKGRVGVTWKVNQMQISPFKYPLDYAIMESDDEGAVDYDEPYLFPEDQEFLKK